MTSVMGTARNFMITSWAREPTDPPLTVAVPGLKFTAWWPASPPQVHALSEFRKIWPDGVTVELERDILEDPDGQKHQVCAYVRIHQYPPDWPRAIGDSLRYFVEQGAAISWVGGWECFLQYSLDEAFRGCYAAYTRETGLVGGSQLDEPVAYIDGDYDIVRRLHLAVADAVRSQEAV
jgi:hypothetical protein